MVYPLEAMSEGMIRKPTVTSTALTLLTIGWLALSSIAPPSGGGTLIAPRRRRQRIEQRDYLYEQILREEEQMVLLIKAMITARII
jgi:hypothetical protein